MSNFGLVHNFYRLLIVALRIKIRAMRFTHLHTHSHYSLLDGLSKIDELIDRAKDLGMESLALTDHGVMYGAIEFYKKAKKAGIKPIIGCEVYIAKEGMHQKRSGIDDKRYHLVLLAKNETGYKNLIKLVSAAHLEGFYYKPRIDTNLLRKHSEGLIGLSACLGGELSRAISHKNYDKAKKIALEYQEIFGPGNYFIELQQHPHIEEQNTVTPQLIKLAQELNIPFVATQDSHYTHTDDADAHDVLLAVQTGNKLDDSDRLTMKNDNFSLLSGKEMYEKFKTLGEEYAVEAMENTNKIAKMCDLEIELGKIKLPNFPLPEGYESPFGYLNELVKQGLEKRYGLEPKPEATSRLEYELSVIKQTGFASYFLIVQDFVNWAKSKGIVVGPGRGSAAGSIVSYLLGITNIDPLKYNLLFERFLNPERISMPDIDLDFADARRDEVLKYVGEKYGKDHVAQVITFGTMAARGGIRDAGRALGYSYDFCDKVAKMIPETPNKGKSALKNCIETVAELKDAYHSNSDVKKLVDAAAKLEGVARHSSTHACAVVITPEPLTEYLPLQYGTEEGDVITQYEMHAVEDLGLLKMDFLGLANLTIIEETLNQIKRNHDLDINIDSIPLDDAKTFKLLQAAKTTGVFQLESSGMKKYLKTLKPTSIDDIIAMISLYRPGPLETGMVEEYIERKHGRKKVTYLHPLMEPILKNTYGVMVYQEQLMQVANTLARFTLPQGYTLIKAVGKKIKSLLDEQREKLIEGMVKNDISKSIAEKIWDFIEPFARYGFNKSHAACYALIGYQTAYLKANYPLEFMAAFMNSETGDVERVAFLIEECKQMNIDVLPPSIIESFEGFTVVTAQEGKKAIRFGLAAIKNVGHNIVRAIIRERQSSGPFPSIEDFISRVENRDLNKKSLESLIRCGALDSFGERNLLLQNLEKLLTYAKDKQKQSSFGQVSLFGNTANTILPPLRMTPTDPAQKWEKLIWEKELLGLFVSDHPLNSYQTQLRFEKVVPIKSITLNTSGSVKIGGVITKTQKIVTKTGRPMIFSWIEDLTSKIEVIVFPNVLEKNPDIWKENTIVVARGKINDRDGSLKFLCDEVKPIAMTT